MIGTRIDDAVAKIQTALASFAEEEKLAALKWVLDDLEGDE